MLKISESPKVKKDLKNLEDNIAKLQGNTKKQAETLLSKLKYILEQIDIAHDSSYNGYINPGSVQEQREDLAYTRHQINQILKRELGKT